MFETMKKIDLEFFGEKSTAVHQEKILVVSLDKQLSFNAHINENAKKGRQSLGLLKRFSPDQT